MPGCKPAQSKTSYRSWTACGGAGAAQSSVSSLTPCPASGTLECSMFKLPAVPLSLTVLRRVCAPGLSCRSCPVRVLQMQTIRSFSELNYWGKSSDAMDRYQAPSGAMYYDPNTTPMWAPTIPVALIPARKPTAGVCEPAL